MKYFLTAPETKRPGSRRAGWLVGVYSVSGASRLLRLGLGFGFRFGLGFGLRFGLLFGRFLEVRGVPAGAFQLEAGRAEQLLKRRFAAGRALGERRLRGLHQKLFLVPTLRTAVFVDRHGQNPWTAIISLILGGKAGNQAASRDSLQNGMSSSMSSNLPAGFFAAGLASAALPSTALASARWPAGSRGSPEPARGPSICMTSPRISVL